MLVVDLQTQRKKIATSVKLHYSIDSLISSFTNHNLFSLPNDLSYASPGPLCLTVSYGHLFFVIPSSLPDNIGHLISLMNEKHEVTRFKPITDYKTSLQVIVLNVSYF